LFTSQSNNLTSNPSGGLWVEKELNPISEKGMGFCFIQINEYWERFESKVKK
jgi:hypothetical protein